MKLYTNENNSVSLKIIISANFVNKCIPIEFVDINDKRFQGPRRLPVLELESGVKLFSSNSACLYIYPPEQNDAEAVDKWLSWEATKLQPLLVFQVNKPEFSTQIEELLCYLNSTLSSSEYLVGGKVTVADICIWVTLYPLYTDEKFKKQFLANRSNILKWFDQLYQEQHFKSAEESFGGKRGVDALQSVASACWYPANTIVNSPTKTQQGSPLSPTHEEKQNIISEEDIKSAVAAWDKGVSSKVKLKAPKKCVLPVQGEKNILITSALPYVNNVPHLGNIIGCVLSADVFARYCRARRWNTLFICGTDEHGTATETKAIEEGLTPKQICDKYFEIHRDIYSWFNISFDHFGRTTTNEQKEIVQCIFKDCHKNGFTSTAVVDQLFCEKCQKFLADRFVEGTCPDCKFEDARGDQCDSCGHLINAIDLINPRCKLCQSTPVIKQSQQLFLELPKIESWLADWFEKTSEGWSHNARVITKAWLNKGLKSRCITRDLKWGIPVPLEGFDQKVFYVWFDAPIGYMSMTKIYTKNWLQWWKKNSAFDVKLYQFMAKDNVPFHSIIFPATLYATKTNYIMMDHLMATEYLNYEDGKFSKSRGIGVFGNDAKETGIPSDVFRFYLLYIRPESQDSNFSWADFAIKVNTELLNNVGNFINRGLMFADKFYNGCIPALTVTGEEKKLLALIRSELKGYISVLDKAKLRDGIKYILNISRHGNLYIQSHKPWELVKGSDDDKSRASTVVAMACNMVGLIASLLQPYMPETVVTISKQLKLPLEHFSIEEEFIPYFETGHKIGKPFPLFTKIELATAELLKKKYSGRQKSETPEKNENKSEAKNTKVNSTFRYYDKSQYETAISCLNDAVSKQGDLVRKLKNEGCTDKEELQNMIGILLDLKRQHTNLIVEYKEFENSNKTEKSANISDLEAQVAEQAEKVRQLKTSGANKTVWQPEVNILLELKKELSLAQGVPVQPQQPSGKKKKSKK